MNKLSTSVAARAPRLATLLFVAGCLLGASGCHSTETTPSAGFASVIISGNTPGQIRDAAVEVFWHEGYIATQKDPSNLVFEKQGSGMNNFAYGSWLGDNPVWIRVKASVVPLAQMSCRLECRAYIVQDRGSATEEELAISRLHKGQYQKILNQVAKKFQPKLAGSAT